MFEQVFLSFLVSFFVLGGLFKDKIILLLYVIIDRLEGHVTKMKEADYLEATGHPMQISPKEFNEIMESHGNYNNPAKADVKSLFMARFAASYANEIMGHGMGCMCRECVTIYAENFRHFVELGEIETDD